MSSKPEMVTVEIAFTARAYFHETVTMRRDTFDRLSAQIDDYDDVDLTEFIDWDNPSSCDVENSDIDTFEIVTKTSPE